MDEIANQKLKKIGEQEVISINPAKQLEKRIVKLRHKGYKFSEIAEMLHEGYGNVLRIYNRYEKENENELFSARIGKVIEIDSIYPKIISMAQDELDLAKETHNMNYMAGWAKLKLEAAREYREFLESIGFIDKKMTSEVLKHNEPETNQSDPILELIKLNKIKLLEEIKKNKGVEPIGEQPATTTI